MFVSRESRCNYENKTSKHVIWRFNHSGPSIINQYSILLISIVSIFGIYILNPHISQILHVLGFKQDLRRRASSELGSTRGALVCVVCFVTMWCWLWTSKWSLPHCRNHSTYITFQFRNKSKSYNLHLLQTNLRLKSRNNLSYISELNQNKRQAKNIKTNDI